MMAIKNITVCLLTGALFLLALCGSCFACCVCCSGCRYKDAEARQQVHGEALVVIRMTEREKLLIPVSKEDFEKDIKARADSVAKSVNAETVNVMTGLSLSSKKILAHFKTNIWTTEQLLEKLKQNPEVLSAEPNHTTSIQGMPKMDEPK